jgi:hypothetical protein
MKWITELPDTQETRFTVSFILDFCTVVTNVPGKNRWAEEYVLHVANEMLDEEYGWRPMDSLQSYEIEVEVI